MRFKASAPLERQVISPLRGAIGQALKAVEYGCFPFEAEILREGKSEILELDGEVRLQFEESYFVFLSWVQVPKWKEANSLAASLVSFSKNGSLEYINVNSLRTWADCLGHRLTSFEILGWNEAPVIVRFHFGGNSILAGVGYEKGFGDGDCVIIRPDHPMWLFSGTEAVVFWSSSHENA